MTSQINYSSKEWAEDVASRLDTAYEHSIKSAGVLRNLVEDLDADGGDMRRGPHVPPIEDALALLRIANSLLARQATDWQGYADRR